MDSQKKKACQGNDRLGKFVLPDKEAVNESLADFKAGRKSKEDVEIVTDVFFEQMRRLNGVK